VESRSRRRLSAVFTGALFLCTAGGVVASSGPIEQTGVFALLGGPPKIVSKFWAVHGSGYGATLKIRQFSLDGKRPILDYDVDMQRVIHTIVVRDDFATFAHLHPAFDTTTGTFSQRFTKQPHHRYYVYADTTPRGIGQQVFRFTMESDGPVETYYLRQSVSMPVSATGPYTVSLARTTLPAEQSMRLNVDIDQGGRPAKGLGVYLGAAAHAVFINTAIPRRLRTSTYTRPCAARAR
jgi:hypothetical protein